MCFNTSNQESFTLNGIFTPKLLNAVTVTMSSDVQQFAIPASTIWKTHPRNTKIIDIIAKAKK